MHRVVTKWLDHRGRWVAEAGPWLVSYGDAEDWAERFRRMGYIVTVESLHGQIAGSKGDDDLRNALASMA